MNELVRFPNGNGWRDAGEGGMYVILAVMEPEHWADNCNVDVYSTLQRNRPEGAARSVVIRMSQHDAAVSAGVKDVWPEYDYESIIHKGEAIKFLRTAGKAVEARWAEQSEHRDDYSHPMLATVLLGSTSASLWDEQGERFFEATHDDLTYQGKVLYEVFKNAYGVEPVILTFLDT